ncbi:MAG TPA: DUF4190 domain-containing protein [Candidatus Microsaccharimonas sp.]|nr:DUF4190 domain-containing protein [Candidatus Microsaccharimonas sp.]
MPVETSTATPSGYPVYVRHDHGNKAIASLVLAVLGIPACLIPIVGLVFGVLALVFGTLSFRSSRKKFAVVGIALGVVVVLGSLYLWMRNAQELVNGGSTNQITHQSARVSGSLQTIHTPCYTTKIPAAMKVTRSAGSCTFLGTTTGSAEQEEVKVIQVPGLTLANLATAARADVSNVVGTIPGGSITKQQSATFAHSQAYEISIKSTDGSAGTMSYVYDATSQGNLVIVLHTQASGTDYGLNLIESHWSWL